MLKCCRIYELEPTFFELVVVGDVQTLSLSDRLRADILAHVVGVDADDLAFLQGVDFPRNAVSVDLTKDELGVIPKVNVSSFDGAQRRWPTLHYVCANVNG